MGADEYRREYIAGLRSAMEAAGPSAAALTGIMPEAFALIDESVAEVRSWLDDGMTPLECWSFAVHLQEFVPQHPQRLINTIAGAYVHMALEQQANEIIGDTDNGVQGSTGEQTDTE